MFKIIGTSIRNNILVGLVLVTPLVVTGFVINLLFKVATNFLPRALKESSDAYLFRFLALLAVLTTLFLIGLLIRNIAGRKLYRFGDRLLTRIPIINRIYVSVRQVSEALVAQSDTLFKEVVLVEYPRLGIYSVGFITGAVPSSVGDMLRPKGSIGEFVTLFIPTTPNPTSGLFILAKRADTIPLAISITDAMKLVISAGAVFPGQNAPGEGPNLLEKLEKALLKDNEPIIKGPVLP